MMRITSDTKADFFSLNAVNDALAPPRAHATYPGAELRPDGDDLLFGGAGNRAGRNDNSCLGQSDASVGEPGYDPIAPCAGGLDVTYNRDAEKFGLTQGDGPCSESPYTGLCSTPIGTCDGFATGGSKYGDVGGQDEV